MYWFSFTPTAYSLAAVVLAAVLLVPAGGWGEEMRGEGVRGEERERVF
jgi:hypothetical protein